MEIIDQPQASVPPAPAPPAPLHAESRLHASRSVRARGTSPLVWGLLALLLLASGFIGWWNYQRLQRVERELVRRVQQLETARTEQLAQQKSAGEQLRELQARSAVVENKVTEASAQKATIEKLFAEVTRSRDERALADVESAVSLAAQQLQFTGNVRGAIVALEEADAKLAAMNQPPAIGARRIVGRDLERLRAMPVAEPVNHANRIDAVITAVDQLPLLNASVRGPSTAAGAAAPGRPAEPAGAGTSSAAGAGPSDAAAANGQPDGGQTSGALQNRVARWFAHAFAAVRDELTRFVRVQRVDRPEALLLAPEQAYFLRENLKLRLTGARASALNRHSAMMRSDLLLAIQTLDRFFDRDNRAVGSAIDTLRQIADTADRTEPPSLAESLAAIRQIK